MNKPKLKIEKTEAEKKRDDYQAKLTSLADKRTKEKLANEDLDDKLNIILEMLDELRHR